MSTGKRLAKRSILGTKVVVPGQDGRYHSGMIQAVKSYEDGLAGCRYSVRFDDTRRTFEFGEGDIVGPGFRSVSEVKLEQGQRVFVTYNNREMQGRVVRHDADSQDVLLTINDGDETLLLKIDDVRLLESRKSARLVNSDTDFSKLADVVITNNANSEKAKAKATNKTFEVPRSDYVQIAGSRKRRTSENLPDEEEVLSECSAAMLLMKLSCSPHGSLTSQAPASLPMYMDLPSPAGSSSGASSFRSGTPSPPLSSSNTDEGIVKDLSMHAKQAKVTIYQCTFPGCQERHRSVSSIESHVRREHLQLPEDIEEEDEDDEHEEEFYYTEIEADSFLSSSYSPSSFGSFSSSSSKSPRLSADPAPPSKHMANLSLADHLDMARPAHEDPGEVGGSSNNNNIAVNLVKKKVNRNAESVSLLSRSLPSQPVTIAPASSRSPGKLILISPPSARSPVTVPGSSPAKASPTKRVRDGKKCRKVYGLEQRDLWCTQCKWKKACARFGANATEPLPGQQQQQQMQQGQQQKVISPKPSPPFVPSGQQGPGTSLLIAAPQPSMVKAIKF